VSKKLILFFGLLLFVIGIDSSFAQQTRFEQANELLSTNQIEEALDLYKSLEQNGFESGALWFNMGISYVQLDSLGKAKYYFLQSKEYKNTEEMASGALEFIEDRFSRRSSVLPKLPWDRFFDWLLHTFGIQGLMAAGLLLLNGAAGGVIASWFVKRGGAWLRKTGYVLALGSLLLISSSAYLSYVEDRYETGVMIEKQTSLYQGPGTDTAVISSVYEGYEMTVDTQRSSEQEEWAYVRLQNGMYGWIDKEQIMSF